MLALDDGRDEIRRERRKPQKARKVTDRGPLPASNGRHGQLGVRDQAFVEIMSPRKKALSLSSRSLIRPSPHAPWSLVLRRPSL